MRKVTFVLALGAVCASILSGCKSKTKYKTPTTPFDKVSVALSGVEKSFANYKIDERDNVSSKKSRSGKRVSQSDSSGALTEIAKLYQSYDSLGDKVDELDLTKPPMVQFSSLKRFFETVGQGYSFGTKFTDSIVGVVYFDPTTGDKKSEELTYKYDYNFTASLCLDINENDVITGDIAFKIDLHQGNDITLQTNWYTTFSLDYEMSKESPTYTLSIFTEILETDLAYLDYGNSYQYDFIDMKSSRVNEWRKFCYEVNKRMAKDETHQRFLDYVAEPDFKGQIGSSKWYKNADLRKISHPNTSRTNSFISALFDKFGLNSTDINSASFTSRGGIKNETIRKVYNEFSSKFGQDAIYSAITGNEGHKQQKVKSSMKVMDEDFKELEGRLTLSKDTTFRQLFNGENGNYSIWYFDDNSEALEQAENLNNLEFRFSIPYGSNNERVTYGNTYLDTEISTLFEDLGAKKYDERLTYSLLEINDNLLGLNIIIPVIIDSELKEEVDLYFMGIFPYQITELGFPEYSGANCLYSYKDDIQAFVDITGTNQTELLAFESTLEQAGSGWKKEETTNSVHYRKFVSPTLYEMEIISNNISSGNVRIVYNKVDWPKNSIKSTSNSIFDFDFPNTENGYFEIDSKKPGTITLKNFSTTEQETFTNYLLSLGEKSNIRNNTLYLLKDHNIYQFGFAITEGDMILDYAYKPQLDVTECEIIIEKDGVGLLPINIDSDLTGYFRKDLFGPGVYKVKKHNLIDDSIVDLSISGASLDSYKDNVSFNEETKELTVINQTHLDFGMAFDELAQIELFELTD